MMANQKSPGDLLEADEPEEEPQTEYERKSEQRNEAKVKKEGESA